MILNWLEYNKNVLPRKHNVHMTVKKKDHQKSAVMVTRHPIVKVLNNTRQCPRAKRNVQFVTRRYIILTNNNFITLVWLLAVTGDCIEYIEGEGCVS